MVKAKIPSRNEKRYNTLMKKQIEPTLSAPPSAARGTKLDELFREKERIIKKGRREEMVASIDTDLLNSKAAKVTLRNIKKVEDKRMRRLQQDLPMILQRGANLHNENNYAFVNKILSNLI